MRKNIIITGVPKSGKSTLLKEIISKFDYKTGFITNEILKDNKRIGFEIETSLGEKSVIASVYFQTDFKVAKYFVNVDNIDLIIPKITQFGDNNLLYIDEIAEMELFSEKFKDLVTKYFDSSNICIATLSCVYDDKFIQSIKNRNDVIIIEIDVENRILKKQFIELFITKIIKARKYLTDSNRFIATPDEVTIHSDHGFRTLKKQKNGWICNCDFFKEYAICSHLIALEEYLN